MTAVRIWNQADPAGDVVGSPPNNAGSAGVCNGWDLQHANAANSAPVCDTAHFIRGGQTVKFATGSPAEQCFVEWSTQMGTQTEIWGRLYVYLTANPGSVFRLVRFFNATTEEASIVVNTSSVLSLRDSAGATGSSTGNVTLALNAWNR